jgi:hypothetical protein
MVHLMFLFTVGVRLTLCLLLMTMSLDLIYFLRVVFQRRFVFLGHKIIRAIAQIHRNLLLLLFRSQFRLFLATLLRFVVNLALFRSLLGFAGPPVPNVGLLPSLPPVNLLQGNLFATVGFMKRFLKRGLLELCSVFPRLVLFLFLLPRLVLFLGLFPPFLHPVLCLIAALPLLPLVKTDSLFLHPVVLLLPCVFLVMLAQGLRSE